MPRHGVFALSILALSITATVWIPTVQVTTTRFLFLSIEIVSNCKSRERKRSLSSQLQTFRIDIFRAREGEFFIDRVTRTSRVRHDLDTIAGHVC